jgi:hypothetical protein
MVLKYHDEDEIYFIDATLEGVTVLPWSSLKSYKDEVYDQIVVRNLNID